MITGFFFALYGHHIRKILISTISKDLGKKPEYVSKLLLWVGVFIVVAVPMVFSMQLSKLHLSKHTLHIVALLWLLVPYIWLLYRTVARLFEISLMVSLLFVVKGNTWVTTWQFMLNLDETFILAYHPRFWLDPKLITFQDKHNFTNTLSQYGHLK